MCLSAEAASLALELLVLLDAHEAFALARHVHPMHILVDVEVSSVLLVGEGSAALGACCVPRRRIDVIADHRHC